MEKIISEKKFSWKDKVGYALGDFGCGLSFALNSYLMLFYTQYIGLSLEVWAVLTLLLKIWDGVNDPIMGGLMDFLKPGKRGKFKTYIFYGSFLLIVSGALCFLPIQNAPTFIKIIACVGGYLIWDMAYTLVNVPYGALSSVITNDPIERTQLSTYRSFGALVSNLAVIAVVPLIVYDDADNLIGNRMLPLALILGVLAYFSFVGLLNLTTERIEVESKKDEKEKYNYLDALKNFFTNRSIIAITIATIFQVITFNGLGNLNQILFQTFFKNAKMSGLITLLTYLPVILVIPFAKNIVKKFGKKESSSVPFFVGTIASLLMFILPIKPDTLGLIIWIILQGIISASGAIFMTISWGMVSDCIDYQELQTGKREEGTIYAIFSLGRKLAQGIGVSGVALLLLLTGYIEEKGANQASYVGNNVRLLVGIIYFVCLLGCFITLYFVYNLDKKKVEEVTNELNKKHKEVLNND